MTTAREWLDAADANRARLVEAADFQYVADLVMAEDQALRSDVPAMVAALRAVLDPETVEAMAVAAWNVVLAHSVVTVDRGDYCCACGWFGPDHSAHSHSVAITAAHAVVVAAIDASLGTVTP